MSRSLDGDAANIVLAELLEFLSHDNGMIGSLAYDEVSGHMFDAHETLLKFDAASQNLWTLSI